LLKLPHPLFIVSFKKTTTNPKPSIKNLSSTIFNKKE